MRIAICSNERPLGFYRRSLADELERRGHQVLAVATVSEAAAAGDLDAAILRLRRTGMAEAGLREAAAAALLLEARDVPFVNGKLARAICADKLVCHGLFALAGLPQPQTLLLDDLTGALPWPQAVVKPVDGARGEAAALVSTGEDARAHSRLFPDRCFIVQPYIDAVGVRVVATREGAVFAVEKLKAEGGWMATFGAGARRRDLAEVPPLYAELAVEMTRAVGGEIIGVDLLAAKEGGAVYALEANSDFGLVARFDDERATPVTADLLEHAGRPRP